ncbi:MAG: restriction endonuclease subunit S [Planctomycetota bacterium]
MGDGVAVVDEKLARAFEVLAESPDGVARMRDLVLSLAVRGKLVSQDSRDQPASELLQRRSLPSRRGNDAPQTPEELDGDVPAGWDITSLAHVAAINPRIEAEDDARAGFVPMSHVPTDYRRMLTHELRSWGEIKAGYTHLADGDVAVAKITPCFQNAKSCLVSGLPGGVGAGTTELVVFRVPPDIVDARFLLILFKSPQFLRGGVATMTGTAGQQRVASDYFRHRPVALPPLTEQRRIIARLDELMDWIDQFEAAKAQREAARIAARDACLATLCSASNSDEAAAAWSTLASRYDSLLVQLDDIEFVRLAILQLAVRGRLVDGHDVSRRDSSPRCPDIALGAPFCDDVGRLPRGWSWARVGEVAETRLGKMLDKAKNKGTPRPYLRNTNVHWFRFDLTSIKRISLEDHEFADLRLRRGDVLICEGGHGIARSAVWQEELPDVVFQKALHRVRPGDRLASRYLVLCMRVLEAASVLRAYYTGAGIPHFTGRALGRVLLALPPLAEQERIVARVAELMAACDRLEAALTTEHARSESVAASLAALEVDA